MSENHDQCLLIAGHAVIGPELRKQETQSVNFFSSLGEKQDFIKIEASS